MLKKRKYFARSILCAVFLAAAFVGWGVHMPQKACGAPLIEKISRDKLLEERYFWQACFTEGVTKALPVHCDSYCVEEFLKGPLGDWGSRDTAGVASLSEGNGIFGKGDEPGCYYFHVGSIRQEDGVHVVDMRLGVTAFYGARSGYDLYTPSRIAANSARKDTENLFDGVTYSWENGKGRPCISFLKNAIGLRLYGVESVDISVTYYDHKSGRPLAISGHGTLGDLKEGQAVSFPENSQIENAFLAENAAEHWKVTGNRAEVIVNASRAEDNKNDISYFFQNTDSVHIHISQKELMERTCTLHRKALEKAGGNKRKLAALQKKQYYRSNGKSLVEGYDGSMWLPAHAVFIFQPRAVGKFALTPAENVEHRVGPWDCTWQEAKVSFRDAPYICREDEEFDILARYQISFVNLQSFLLKEQLGQGLMIEGDHEVWVYNQEGEEITSQFIIKIHNFREIICIGKDEAIMEDSFSEEQSYTFRFRVRQHQGTKAEEEWGDGTFLFSSRVTLCMNYKTKDGQKEKTAKGNPVWIRSQILPALALQCRASRYEYQVGEKIIYTVEVTQTKRGTYAKDVVITGTELPWPLKLLDGFTAESSSHRSCFVIKKEDKNGWRCTGPRLQYGESVIIRFQCLATEASNGREWESLIYASAGNLKDIRTNEEIPPIMDRAEIWVNSPSIQVDKQTNRESWQSGETVEYQVTAANDKAYTVAKKVVLTGKLPKGLYLAKGEKSLEMIGMPQEVNLPVRDEKTGMALNSKKPVNLQIETKDHSWKLTADYFPSQTVLVMKFSCLAARSVKGKYTGSITIAAGHLRQEAGSKDNLLKAKQAVLSLEEEIYNPYCTKAKDGRLKGEFRVGEEVEYRVCVRNCRPGTVVKNLQLENLHLPEYLELQDVRKISVEGIPKSASSRLTAVKRETVFGILEQEDGWRLQIDTLPYNLPVTVTWRCTIGGRANGKEIISSIKARGENAKEVWTEGRIWVNTPRLIVEEQTDREQYQAGDVLAYTMKAAQTATGCVARNVLFESVIETAGVKLLRHFVTTWKDTGEKTVENQWMSQQALVISTSRNLIRKDRYLVWDPEADKEIPQKLWNPLGITGEKNIYIEYFAEIAKANPSRNHVVNETRVSSQEQYPVEILKETKVLTADFKVNKESDRRLYQAGEDGHIHNRIEGIQETGNSSRLTLEEIWDGNGVQIQRNTLLVTLNQKPLGNVKVVWKEKGFILDIKEEIQKSDQIDLYYQTVFDAPQLSKIVLKNIVRAKGSNTKEFQEEILVRVQGKTIRK